MAGRDQISPISWRNGLTKDGFYLYTSEASCEFARHEWEAKRVREAKITHRLDGARQREDPNPSRPGDVNVRRGLDVGSSWPWPNGPKDSNTASNNPQR